MSEPRPAGTSVDPDALEARAAEYRAELRRLHPLDDTYRELGRRHIAEIRARLAQRTRTTKGPRT